MLVKTKKESITDSECYNGMRIRERNCDCNGDFRLPYQIEERTKIKFKIDFYKQGYLKVIFLFLTSHSETFYGNRIIVSYFYRIFMKY